MDLDSVIESFRADPGRSAFVLDFDGTLSAIVDEPELARPVAGAAETLRSLGAVYRVVAIVSGRRAGDLFALLGDVEPVRCLGVYGAEEIVGGRVTQSPEAESWRGMASRLARDAEALILSEGLDGCEVEYKDIAVSVHYRQARSARAGEAILSWAREAAPKRRFSAGLGRKVVEMRPAAVSKAGALEQLVTSASFSNLFLAGDDLADVEAMEKARVLGLETCLIVGIESQEKPQGLEAAADLLVGSPREFLDLLHRFL